MTGPSSSGHQGHPRPARAHDLLERAVLAATYYLEVRSGRRPLDHLVGWVSPTVQRQLGGLVRRRRRQPPGNASLSLLRVWIDRQDAVTNVVVVLGDGTRALPVAMALRAVDGCPQVVALGLPQDRRARSVAAPEPTQLPPQPIASGRAPEPTCLIGLPTLSTDPGQQVAVASDTTARGDAT